MSAIPGNVFLVSGQRFEILEGGVRKVSPEIEQRVVVAQGDVAAYQLLASQEPGFLPSGHASLEAYDQAAMNIRAALQGEKGAWTVFYAPGMQEGS